MKQIIFNVGGALSSYIEFEGKKLLIDVAQGNSFNPVVDFLIPLFEKRKEKKNGNEKYNIDQLVVSHPHKDHISAIGDLDSHFHVGLLTTPNDNVGMPDGHKINWKLIGNEKDSSLKVLRNMLKDRTPPLTVLSKNNQQIYYLAPEIDVEQDAELKNESYINNISIAVMLMINKYNIFMPGDLQKLGMKKLIESNPDLQKKLEKGIDVMIASHHGLKSSFSTLLFEKMKNKKTRSIHVISEKQNNTEESRDVDTRYSSSDYCSGKNNLSGGNGVDECYQVKTSRGHILIDYYYSDYPRIDIISDTSLLVDKFVE